MRLKHLFKGIPGVEIKGGKDTTITGVTSHSHSVEPGNLFLAKKGATFDGTTFIPQVKAAGAVAVVHDLYDPFLDGIIQVIHPNVAEIESILASRFYCYPSRDLFLVGITGTNGKTTTAYIIRHLLKKLNYPTGLFSSIERIVGETYLPTTTNTPEQCITKKLLRDMVTVGEKGAVMEVTSHGLVQGRVKGLDFDVAIFTNLTQDHLDYHGDMLSYGEAKAQLFQMLTCDQLAVVNADDPASEVMLKNCKGRVLKYGIEQRADLQAHDVTLSAEGFLCWVTYQGEEVKLEAPLIGRFNVYNALAALSVPLFLGKPLKKCVQALRRFQGVPGRMERVENGLGIHIFVDYSHTEDSLRNALETLNEFKKKRVITVFGCGGDRDHDKRPKMGSTAEALSDRVIVTSDNSRSEDPMAIIYEISKGLKKPSLVGIEPDRRLAIFQAVQEAQEGDIVLIAGKGHETYQLVGGKSLPFDDRAVAREACEMVIKEVSFHSC